MDQETLDKFNELQNAVNELVTEINILNDLAKKKQSQGLHLLDNYVPVEQPKE